MKTLEIMIVYADSTGRPVDIPIVMHVRPFVMKSIVAPSCRTGVVFRSLSI